MTSPATASNATWNGYLYGIWPWVLKGRHPELATEPIYDAYLAYYWHPTEKIGNYVVLVRNTN